MTTLKSNLVPIVITPGVQPSTDKTALSTTHFTASDKIRFRFGVPMKIGGWAQVQFSNSNTIVGLARSMYATIISAIVNTVIGTHQRLYSLIGSTLVNITPLSTSTTAIANSLTTDYGTLANNPITTVLGSSIITVADANAPKYAVGDTITLSGATATGGITIGQINVAQVVHTVGASSYTVITAGTASSSTSGGGNAVVRATGRLSVAATAHGMATGDRTKIAGAADTGGVLLATINVEFIIRNVTVNAFDIMTTGTATSSVAAGGGVGTTFQPQIAAGNINQSFAQGYGDGKYGVGLYGTSLMSSANITYPRIWFLDRFGNNVVGTAGGGTGLYTWAADVTVAPTLVTNAPTAINYAFVSDNIIVTFGAGGTDNRILACDQAASTVWTGSSTNQVFDYTVNGASKLVSHVSVNGVNLIFTDHETYLFQYIGLPGVWKIQLLEPDIGIIAPMARCAVGGVAYWMDVNNFYMWAGGNAQIIPSNSQPISTLYNYVFKNLNAAQQYKIFIDYNEQYDEIAIHYPSAGSNEPDRVARFSRTDLTWVPDTIDRTCAEYPNEVFGYPRLIDSSSVLYSHEQGNDANGVAMPWSLTTNLRSGIPPANYALTAPKLNSMLVGFIPDSIQTGNINVEIVAKRYPQSGTNMYDQTYTVTPTTEFVTTEIGGRFWQYMLSGNALGQQWQGGQWFEYVQQSSNI